MEKRNLFFLVLLMVALVLPGALPAQDEAELAASLEIQEAMESGKNVKMRFVLKNPGSEGVWVLRWFTPLEGIAGEIFDIKRDGGEVAYHGILVRRGDPQDEDYVFIEAGQSVSAEVDLAESYDFSKAGDYGIAFRAPRISHVAKRKADMVMSKRELPSVKRAKILSEKVTVRILAESAPRIPPVRPDAAAVSARQVTFTGCSSAQETKINEIQQEAVIITGLIPPCLSSLTTSERDHYEHWFGPHTATRFSTVLAGLNQIKTVFTTANITYNCSGPHCQSSWLAYVYKGGPVEIFLCPGFWRLPDSGKNSKLDTLIHEVSHEAADTEDWEYGIANCENLATTNPGRAIENADNYAYYCVDFKCGGSELLMYSLMLILVVLSIEGYRRRRERKTV